MAEPNHDDMAIWLLDEKNRQYVKDKLQLKLTEPHWPFWANTLYSFAHEYHYKPAYEAPEYYDAIENFFYEKENNRLEVQVLWEIKPELNDLGDTLRQLRRYKKHTAASTVIVLYFKSRFSAQQLADYFNSTEIYIFQTNANVEKAKNHEEI